MTELIRGQYKDESGQPAFWLSWSRLQEYEKCQQASKLHMQGLGATVKQGRNFVSGTVADRAMRKFLEQESGHKKGQMEAFVYELWSKYTKDSDEYIVSWNKKDPLADEATAKALSVEAVNALEPFLFARVLPYEYEPEWRFKVPLGLPSSQGFTRTVVLNGGADIIVHNSDADEWFVYDLKTTRNESYVQGSTLGQLIFYQLAVRLTQGAEYGKIKTAFLTPACKTQYHSLEISDQDRTHLMSRIITFAQSVWDDTEPTLTEDLNVCWWCDLKAVCPRYTSVLVEGEHKVSLADTAKIRKAAKVNK